MSHTINKGFSLIELLVAVAILAIISIISVRILYDSVTIQSKQISLEESSENYRVIARNITNSIVGSKDVYITGGNEIRITGIDSCRTIKYDSDNNVILQANIVANPCSPPVTGFSRLTGDSLQITGFSLTPDAGSITILTLHIEGIYKNSLGDHPFEYDTTVSQRI